MTKQERIDTIQRAIDMGDCAYDFFEHARSMVDGMRTIIESPPVPNIEKLRLLERLIKATAYQLSDSAAFVDGETSEFRAIRNRGNA